MTKPMVEVACAIIMEGQSLLVTQRSQEMPHPLKWEFPGGKLKIGETPEACIIREIREELGVEIHVMQLLPAVRYTYTQNIIKLIPFVCRIERGNITLSEHRLYRWVHRSELEELDWLEADVGVLALIQRYC